MSVDLVSLRMFVSVIEEKSLTRAAEREHIVVSALSKRMSDLEGSLGVPLLIRRSRGVAATEAGKLLASRARAILYEVGQIQSELTDHVRGLRGYVRLAANSSSIIQFLPAELTAFLDEHPRVQIDLVEGNSNEVLRLIGENQADLGICAWGPGRYQVETFPYHQDQLVLLAPHQHPLAERRALFFHETLEYDFVEIRRGSALSNLMLGAASRANMPLKFRLQVGSFDAVVAMVRAGLALGVAPEAILRNDQRGYRVIRLKDDWATRRLSVVVRDWNALPEAARQVAKRLIQSR